jgi:hypothetical protein
MTKDNYIDMINQLFQKTEEKKTIWQKGSRDNEFSIVFKSGLFVIDKWNADHEIYYDFQIYNDNGDRIYGTNPVDPSNEGLYHALENLHDSVMRCYYKVDETIMNFSKELNGDGIIGEESAPGDDIPF